MNFSNKSVKFWNYFFSPPKGTSLRRTNHVVWRIKRENRSNGLFSGGSDETKKRSKHSKVLGVYFTYVGGKTPWADWAHIFLEVDIPDVITCFKFGDDRFRGLASAEGQILPFPIDFDGRP